MKNFSSVFQGNPRPHVSFLNRFCPSTQKHNSDWKRDHLWWEHAHLLVSEPNLSYLVHGIDWIQQSDVIVVNTSVFIHPHEYSTTAFSKISAPESVFLRRWVFGDCSHRLIVWTRTQTGQENLRFQTKMDTCWRGLISISHKKYIQTLSKTDTFVTTGTKCPSKSNVRLNIENQIKGVEKGTNSTCPFYRGVRLSIESQIKELKTGTNSRCPCDRGVH